MVVVTASPKDRARLSGLLDQCSGAHRTQACQLSSRIGTAGECAAPISVSPPVYMTHQYDFHACIEAAISKGARASECLHMLERRADGCVQLRTHARTRPSVSSCCPTSRATTTWPWSPRGDLPRKMQSWPWNNPAPSEACSVVTASLRVAARLRVHSLGICTSLKVRVGMVGVLTQARRQPRTRAPASEKTSLRRRCGETKSLIDWRVFVERR